MEVKEELVYNFLVDLKKREIHPVDRAEILKQYIKEQKTSIKGLAKELGIPQQTLQDWHNYGRIEKKEYDRLINRGISKTNIYQAIREESKKNTHKEIIVNDLNIILTETIEKIKGYIHNPPIDSETHNLLRELRNTINRIELHIEKRNKC